jgi:hypothetical protein
MTTQASKLQLVNSVLSSLPTYNIVEVVLRHSHRHCPREARSGSLLKGLRSLELAAMEEARWT